MQQSMDTELCLYTIRINPTCFLFVSFLLLGWITAIIGVRVFFPQTHVGKLRIIILRRMK
jgi:hypothetical protein